MATNNTGGHKRNGSSSSMFGHKRTGSGGGFIGHKWAESGHKRAESISSAFSHKRSESGHKTSENGGFGHKRYLNFYFPNLSKSFKIPFKFDALE